MISNSDKHSRPFILLYLSAVRETRWRWKLIDSDHHPPESLFHVSDGRKTDNSS